jgi:hypothetical protein
MSRKPLSKRLGVGLGLALLAGVLAAEPSLAASGAAEISSLKRSDFVSPDDLKRARGGYKLSVPGVGAVRIRAIRTGRPGERCLVHLPTLVKMIQASPPSPGGQDTLEVNRVEIDESLGLGDHMCIGEGSGCAVIVLDDGNDDD